ncbi:hypothetical protein AVEN_243388-1 [Araneus ventricosus]|uniref:Uncharacterized protein n=1 Tax=Araneus ventricosus TaxID=182803 RepID=A0A4Y2MRJ9_ARAVE|nr:hypothetical protein AVEN_243388-1 [Araneus ventricosus]
MNNHCAPGAAYPRYATVFFLSGDSLSVQKKGLCSIGTHPRTSLGGDQQPPCSATKTPRLRTARPGVLIGVCYCLVRLFNESELDGGYHEFGDGLFLRRLWPSLRSSHENPGFERLTRGLNKPGNMS